ncbi:MAG: murein biosynthesis integral membrane protein MurJ [Anaerolineae bacterium]|nr:murein biosynthesis integral membrane protein MurJ [Anaerolineae bacterium]
MTVENPAVEAARTPVETQQETNAGVARATGVLALGNISSRILGLGREIVITNLFGATGASDAFRVAIIVPRALYDLLIGGHVNSALIPVLSEVVTVKGRGELWRLVSVLLSLVTAMMALLVVVLQVFAPQVVQMPGSGYSEPTLALATHLLRLTSPALIFLSLFAILSGTLYALRQFTLPAFAGVIFNGSIVVFSLLFAPPPQVLIVLNDGALPAWLNARPAEGVTVVAVGWLIGAFGQLALQLPGLYRSHLRLMVNWRHPALRRILKLYAPVMVSLVIDTLVIRLVSYNLASLTGEGSISKMELATTLIQFPQGLIATAISIAILPTLSRQAVVVTPEGRTAFRDTLGLGLRLAITLILPAAVGLFVLGQPIVALLFEHGAFTAADTATTALALRLYLIGLPFAAVDLLLVYAFYARQDTLTPALVGLLSLTLYMVTALLLFPHFGLFSLMIADSLKHVVHALVSTFLLTRRLQGFGNQRLLLTIAKAGAASVLMGVTATLALPYLTAWIGAGGLIRELLLVLGSGLLSVAVFLVTATILRMAELRWLVELIWRRLAP